MRAALFTTAGFIMLVVSGAMAILGDPANDITTGIGISLFTGGVFLDLAGLADAAGALR